MNAIFRIGIILGVLTIVVNLIISFVGDPISSTMHDSLVYFLIQMAPLKFLIPLDTFYACLRIFLNFFISLTYLRVIIWLTHLVA